MATVAQRYLEIGEPAPMSDVENRKHIMSAHMSIVGAMSNDNCSKYVFEQSPSDTVERLYKAKALTSAQWAKNIQLPSDPIWIEYPILTPVERTKIGVYIASCDVEMKYEDGTIAKKAEMLSISFVMCNDAVCHTFGVLAVDMPPYASQESFEMLTLGWPRTDGLDSEDTITAYVRDALDCLFVLSIPKVCEIKKTVHSHKLQKARARRGKRPLIEFKQVTIMIDKPRIKYEPNSNSTLSVGDRFRESPAYHAVEGHFRTYHREQTDEFIRWVPKFWRGDIQKGIILKERHIKASMEAKE